MPWLNKLVDQGIITLDQLAEAAQTGSELGMAPADALVRLGYASGAAVATAMAEAYGCDVVSLEGREIAPDVLELVPHSVALEHLLIPLAFEDGELLIATTDPTNYVVDKLGFVLSQPIMVAIATAEEIEASIRRHYGESIEYLVEHHYAFLPLDDRKIAPAILDLVPESVARENKIIPVEFEGDVLLVAAADPTDDLTDSLRRLLNREVRTVLAGGSAIRASIDRHYGTRSHDIRG